MRSINCILGDLSERKEYLRKCLKEIKKYMAGMPEGKLRTTRQRSLYRYYEVTDPANPNGEYIHVSNIAKAKKLAQKDYYEKQGFVCKIKEAIYNSSFACGINFNFVGIRFRINCSGFITRCCRRYKLYL